MEQLSLTSEGERDAEDEEDYPRGSRPKRAGMASELATSTDSNINNADSATTQENLEEIVSHLLQHNLHLQQLLLSKQRRGLLLARKKQSRMATANSSVNYETSDTENDDLISHDSGVPITSINSFNSINNIGGVTSRLKDDSDEDGHSTMLDGIDVSDVGLNEHPENDCAADYVEFYFNKNAKDNTLGNGCSENNYNSSLNSGKESINTTVETKKVLSELRPCRDGGSSSEATSMYSSALSITNSESKTTKDISVKKHNSSFSNNMSDFGSRRTAALKRSGISNYDNIMSIWSSLRGREKRSVDKDLTSPCTNSHVHSESEDVRNEEMRKHSLRRAQSFNSELSLWRKSNRSAGSVILKDNSNQRERSPEENKERRVTIAVCDGPGEKTVTDDYKKGDPKLISSRFKGRSEAINYDTEDNFTDCSENLATRYVPFSTVHPEHKIYTKAILSKNSLKNVLSKLTSTRKSLANEQEVGGSQHSDLEKSGDKTPSKLVYTARQCTKTLKERIKQIKSEDDCGSTCTSASIQNQGNKYNKTNVGHINKKSEQIYDLQEYQQGSSSIGAKLATTPVITNYQVPRGRLFKESLAQEQVDENESVLQSFETDVEKSVVENLPTDETTWKRNLEELTLDDSSGSLEEFDDDNSGGDCCYEKSFEAIENILENDIFRDSAIYSDPEDPDSKISAAELTKNFPRSILNRVSKSPSLRSANGNSLPRKNSGLTSAFKTNDPHNSHCKNDEAGNDVKIKEDNTDIINTADLSINTTLLKSQSADVSPSNDEAGDSCAIDNGNTNTTVEPRGHSISPSSSTDSAQSALSNSLSSDPSVSESQSKKENSHTESASNENIGMIPSDRLSDNGTTSSSVSTDNFSENKLLLLEQTSPAAMSSESLLDHTSTSNSSFSDAADSSINIVSVHSKLTVTAVDRKDIGSLSDEIELCLGFLEISNTSANVTAAPSNECPNIKTTSPTIIDKGNKDLEKCISPLKKVPPPVPVKPESVRSKASRKCGSKILGHLKSLEECSRFSKSDCMDTSLDGLKSLQERRRELKSHSSDKSINSSIKMSCCDSEGNDTKNGANEYATSPTNTKPPQSPLMSVRSFVSRNVANVTSRASRSSRVTTIKTKTCVDDTLNEVETNIAIENKNSCDLESITDASSSDEKNSRAGSDSIKTSLTVTRRKSIKAIGSYISKFNSRSSSVPPRLHKIHLRHSTFKTSVDDQMVNVTEDSSTAVSYGSQHDESSKLSEHENDSADSNLKFPDTNRIPVNLGLQIRTNIRNSASYASSLSQAPSSIPSIQKSVSSDLSFPEPRSLPASPSAEGGELTEVAHSRRPRGWVRHVVGRLQQVDDKKALQSDANSS